MKIIIILIFALLILLIGWRLIRLSSRNRKSGISKMKLLFQDADRIYFDFISRKVLNSAIPSTEIEVVCNQALVVLRPSLQRILSLSKSPDLQYNHRPHIESKYLKALSARIEQLMDANNYQTLLTIEDLSKVCAEDVMADLESRFTDSKLNNPI